MRGWLAKLFASARFHPWWTVFFLALLLLAGLGIYRLGRYLEATRQFKAAQQAVTRRDFQQAQKHFTRCLALRPNWAEGHFLAARTARRARDYDRVWEHLKACKRLDYSPDEIALEHFLVRAQQGDLHDVASPLLALVEKEHKDSLLILEALSAGYLHTYQLAKADRCLEYWLERDPNDVQALLWHGEIEERKNRLGEAAGNYRKAVQLAPEHEKARLQLAQVLQRMKRDAQAVEHFEYLYQREPDNPVVVGVWHVAESRLGSWRLPAGFSMSCSPPGRARSWRFRNEADWR